MSEENTETFSVMLDDNLEVVSVNDEDKNKQQQPQETEQPKQEVKSEVASLNMETGEDFQTPEQVDEQNNVEEDIDFDFNLEGEEEVNEGGEEEKTLQEQIQELRDQQEALRKENEALKESKTFEEKYSKEEYVMPGVSEYDYAMYGKEVAENGKLSDESYEKLEKLGIKRELVDGHIANVIGAQATPQQEVSQDTIRNNHAADLNMSRQDFDNVLGKMVNSMTPQQQQKFDNLTVEQQQSLIKGFSDKLKEHQERVDSKKLRKGSGGGSPQQKTNEFSNSSNEELLSKLSQAASKNDTVLINKINIELEKRGGLKYTL